MSIKSPEYKLAHVYVVEVLRELLDSANRPLLVAAIDQSTGLRSEYVVKINASERMTPVARMFELVAAFMAIELDLLVVEPVVVDIGQDFVDAVQGRDFFLRCSKSLGFNYGSAYRGGLMTLDNAIALTSRQKEYAQEIVVFDMLIGNVDRNAQKPNMITDGNQLVLLDHELAFGFVRVLPFLRNQQPWVLDEEDRSVMMRHCLYSRVKGQVDRLDDFCEKLIRFDSDFWEHVRIHIPDEWYDADAFASIVGHIDLMVENRQEFIRHIKILLA